MHIGRNTTEEEIRYFALFELLTIFVQQFLFSSYLHQGTVN